MAEPNYGSKSRIRGLAFKALKATMKAIIFYVLYFVLWSFIAPLGQLVPGLQQMAEAFVVVYITLMIISDLTSGTIFHYFFGAARALFVMCYLILALKGGVFTASYEGVNLMVDLRLFLSIAMLLSLLGFSRSILGAVNCMSEKAEATLMQ